MEFIIGLLATALFTASALSGASDLDIAPFARRCCVANRQVSQVAFDYDEASRAGGNGERASDGRYIYGLQWAEERDVKEVRVRFRRGSQAEQANVEYWFRNWPYPPPQMPSIEDPLDDPWQGTWLKAATQVACEETVCSYRFLPLNEYENPNAKNLPTWIPFNYRRTLKLRLVFGSKPVLEKVEVFSGSKQKPVQLRIELSAGETSAYEWKGRIHLYNGFLTDVTLWNGAPGDAANPQHFQLATGATPKGLLVNLIAAEPSLPGSNDVSIVTLESGERTFSFAVPDVEKGPVHVPDFNAYVTLASDPRPFSPAIIKAGEKIREKLIAEPEQSYERASEEIPPLDSVAREGDRLYLPLAADSSWQKFAFEWGGHVWIGKNETKAKGAELNRLEWREDRIAWRIGTGAMPNFRPGSRDSKLSVLEDYMPVATAAWTTEGINYTEEAFATLLSGPLSPDDAGRGEQTPAVLMLKLTAQNTRTVAKTSHVWLGIDPLEELEVNEGFFVAKDHPLVRAYLRLPGSARVSVDDIPDGAKTLRGIHAVIELAPDEHKSFFVSLPFIPRLSTDERERLASLDYESERARVVSYWREMITQAVPFDVPEHRFVTFAKAVIAHIHIGVTKDPKSGLYMVPEASYTYQVFANGTAYHCAMLDALGHHQLASRYLDPLVQLQGSVPLQGMFTGDQKEVYYGARVDAGRDYTHVSYGLDQGTVLWGLAEHYFFTRDRDWLRRIEPSMMRAADWIIQQRGLTQVLDGDERVPEYGLLPPARLEDPDDWWHWFSVNAVAVEGLTRLAQALADIGAPEAKRYAQRASAYRQDLRDDVLRASRLAPVVKLRDNTYVPYVPTRPYQRIRLFGPLRVGYYSRYPEKVLPLFRLSATREVFGGPILLLDTGVFGVDEPLARWVLDDWEDNATLSSSLGINVHGWVDDEYWFSRGGMQFEANYQNPILTYLRRNEIPAAIRLLYNDFVSCLYPDVNAFTEEYHQWRHGSGPFYKSSDEARFLYQLRYTLVREEGETLWLAAGVPRRWLAPGERIEVRAAPTYFGPVSYRIEAAETSITAQVELPMRNQYQAAWLVIRAPEGKQVRSVEIDGKPWQQFDPVHERIRLPLKPTPLQISVRF